MGGRVLEASHIQEQPGQKVSGCLHVPRLPSHEHVVSHQASITCRVTAMSGPRAARRCWSLRITAT